MSGLSVNWALPIQIMVDDREARNPVAQALSQFPSVQVQFKRLAVGDYVVDNRCVFERKTVLDFANSIVDGRLFTQACKLAGLLEPAALILEGRAADLAGTHMRREALQGAMVSLALVFHLPVLRTLDSAETARILLYAGQQMRRNEWQCGGHFSRRPKPKRKRQLRLLQGLPGVGPARAAQLLDAFGSVEAVMTASQELLEAVDGFGSKTATAIRDVLQEAPLPYGQFESKTPRAK
jgi:DNA excision repair protein ERCC-4